MERLRVLLAFLVVFVLACFTSVTEGLDNGLGQKPQMGWNSWNQFGCKIDETLIRESIDALVSTGLAKAGYRYMVCTLPQPHPNAPPPSRCCGHRGCPLPPCRT